METNFKRILIEKCNIDFDTPIILGISGGVDSACLLDLFSKIELPLVIAHYHHGLRKSADDDARFVEMLGKKYQIPFEIGSGNVKEFAESRGLSIEEAARISRYKFLFRIADKYSAQSIAVAHNADDQVETVLMHLLRGSGLSGLTGMEYKTIVNAFHKTIPIIRPLINSWRSEIESYINQNDLEYCKDLTNLDTKYNRNKIRHEIIPFLEQSYPGLKDRIWNMANILLFDEQFIDDELNDLFLKICEMPIPSLIRCETNKFLESNISLQRRLIRKAIFTINIEDRDVTFQVIDRAIEFINENESGRIDLIHNLILETTEKSFYIFSKGTNWCEIYFPQMEVEKEIFIPETGEYLFGNNWVLKVEFYDRINNINFQSETQYSGWLDFDEIGGFPLFLGISKSGERFKPLGLDKGSIKLSKFLINEKLPKSARKQWPLLKNSTNELLWVPGFRPANKFRITENTKKILKFKLERIV